MNGFMPSKIINSYILTIIQIKLCILRELNNIPINMTGHERMTFSVVLSSDVNGTKLLSLVIFKRKILTKGDFPKSMRIYSKKDVK